MRDAMEGTWGQSKSGLVCYGFLFCVFRARIIASDWVKLAQGEYPAWDETVVYVPTFTDCT